MKLVISILIFMGIAGSFVLGAESVAKDHHEDQEHTEGKEHKHDEAGSGDDHRDEDKHDDHHEHEEENSSIGPEKGITVFSEDAGFQLSPEANKNFEIQTVKLVKSQAWWVPSTAILYSGEEINLYRVRDGFYKRIDFSIVSKNEVNVQITSRDLKIGDEIVTRGVGFLRSAEIVATGGAPEGHSH